METKSMKTDLQKESCHWWGADGFVDKMKHGQQLWWRDMFNQEDVVVLKGSNVL